MKVWVDDGKQTGVRGGASEHWVDFPVLYSRFSLVTYFIHGATRTLTQQVGM